MRIATIFLLCIATNAYAQDLQPVQKAIAANDYLLARQQIESILSDKKYAAEAAPWYYRGKIYTEAVRRYDTIHPSLLPEALRSYKRYQELDPRNRLMEPDKNLGLFHLYDLSYNTGVSRYDAGNYEPAYWYFKSALETEEYIVRKGFSFNGERFPALDTQLVSLVAFSAYLSKKEDEAIPYFEKLAALKMAGEEYKGVYTLLTQYFQKRNDLVKAARYLNTGRQLFPDNEYWLKLEFGNPAGERERFSRYDALIQKYSDNTWLLKNYAIELFNYCYSSAQPVDYNLRQDRLQTVLSKWVFFEPNSALANAILSEHIYNQVYDMDEVYRGMKDDTPAEETRKKAYAAKLDAKYEELLKWSVKAYDLYKLQAELDASSKQHLKKLVNQVVVYYQWKKDAVRASEWMGK